MRLPLLLAVALLAPVAAQAQVVSAPTMLVEGTLLDVSATGKVTRTPDLATIRSGVVTQAATASAALSDNSTKMSRLLAALKRAGVGDRDVQTAIIQLQPQYRYQQNEAPVITGYQASNSVSVRFRDVARSGAILDALVREGANQIDGPTLSIERADGALDEARTDAVAKARARAELYARAAGLRVERILSISESGDFAPAPPPVVMMRAQALEAADTRVVPGEQDVAVTVAVRFLLK
jgi:uncharacterized protein YggE